MCEPISFFSSGQKAKFERGWPHVREVARKPEMGTKALETAKEVLDSTDPIYLKKWPRLAAIKYVRASGKNSTGKLTRTVKTALSRENSLEPEELDKMLSTYLRMGVSRYQHQVEEFVLLLEAFYGTETALDAILSRFERFQHRQWELGQPKQNIFGIASAEVVPVVAYQMGFLLHRVAPKRKLDFVRRTLALRDRVPSGTATRRSLELVLGGGEAARRLGMCRLAACCFVMDDPELIQRLSVDDRSHTALSPRFVYLGGAELLEDYIRRTSSLPRWATQRFIDQFGTIKHPTIVEMMAILAAKKATRAPSLKWLAAHGDYSVTHLRHLATTGGKSASGAKIALNDLE